MEGILSAVNTESLHGFSTLYTKKFIYLGEKKNKTNNQTNIIYSLNLLK